MQIKSVIFDSDEQWLSFRENYVNSTECAPMFNIGEWASLYKLWHLKNGTLDDQFKETSYTKAGKKLECVIAEMFAEQYDCTVEKIQEYRYCDETKTGSTYDYIITSGEFEGYILECKLQTFWGQKLWIDSEPPLQYKMQAQHQMLHMPESRGVVLAVLNHDFKIQSYIINESKKIHDKIISRAADFWQSIADQEEPELNYEKDSDTAKEVHKIDSGTVIDSDDNLELLVTQFEETNIQLKKLEKTKEELKARIFVYTDAARVELQSGQYLDLKNMKEVEGTLITEAMLGKRIYSRKSYRNCIIRGKKVI